MRTRSQVETWHFVSGITATSASMRSIRTSGIISSVPKVRSYSEDSKTAEAFQEWYIRFGNAQEVKAAIASNVPEDLVTNTLLMPNPAANNVTVQCNSSHEGIATMSIINSVGMEVFKNTVSLSYGSNSLQCDVSTLSSGTYLLRIGNGVALSTFPLTIVR